MICNTRCKWFVDWAVALCVTVSATGLLRGDDASVWELKPYRIQALLVPEWTPDWSDQRLAEISQAVVRRAQVEIGRPWQLDVRPAPLAIRRSVLASPSPPDLKNVASLFEPYRDYDKVILVMLRVDSLFRGAVAWEFDWASKRWSVGRRFTVAGFQEVDRAVFESVYSVFSPLGVVKMASGQRVVLRQRAALLRVRNHRRAQVKVGGLFEVLRRDRGDSMPNAEDATLLVVEEMSEQAIRCRVVSKSGNPLERTAADRWIAVQARVTHTGTEFVLTAIHAGTIEPLTQCEVWVSDRRGDPGKLVGCPDAAGVVVLPATGKLQWLKIKVGAITLRDYCVVAGARPRQIIQTQLTRAHLQHAAVLAAGRDAVAELVTLRDVYQARYQHRLDGGRDADAKALLSEMHERLKPRAEALLESIRQQRNAVIAVDADETSRFAGPWAELTGTLNKLAEPQAVPETPAK